MVPLSLQGEICLLWGYSWPGTQAGNGEDSGEILGVSFFLFALSLMVSASLYCLCSSFYPYFPLLFYNSSLPCQSSFLPASISVLQSYLSIWPHWGTHIFLLVAVIFVSWSPWISVQIDLMSYSGGSDKFYLDRTQLNLVENHCYPLWLLPPKFRKISPVFLRYFCAYKSPGNLLKKLILILNF